MALMSRLTDRASDFQGVLNDARAKRPDVKWYNYNSLNNFSLMQRFKGPGLDSFDGLSEGLRILDVGAADGDTSFFLERQGGKVSIVDNPQTNANDCLGIETFKELLGSDIELQTLDLDFQDGIKGQHDLVVFLGILYHLRNPIFALTNLAQHAAKMLVSTTVIRQIGDTDVSALNAAWFHECRESNNDPTNYWSFSPQGLRTALKRSGWVVKDEFILWSEGHSADHRMFCYCERVPNWADLRLHHDF